MARTEITASTFRRSPVATPVSANLLDIILAASDPVNGNFSQITTSLFLILFWNSDASARTITISSALDDLLRYGDITNYNIDAGDHGVLVMPRQGWVQTDGQFWFNTSNALVKVGVFLL